MNGALSTSTAIVLAMPRPQATVSYDTALTPTGAQYAAFEAMFAYYNRKLFDGELPRAMLTFSRKTNARGFFAPDAWTNDGSGEVVCTIALNPDHLDRPSRDVIGTLVHEMVHLWQHVHGEQNSRRSYHNSEWAAKMERIGLMPSSTGEPGGKKTGQRVTHYVIKGGEFERAFLLMADDWYLPFIAGVPERDKKSKAKNSKTKFQCRTCTASAWGKPDLLIVCGECGGHMPPVK